MLSRRLIGIAALLLFAGGSAFAATEGVWQAEAETVVHNMRYGAQLVDDPLASGGQAIRIPYQEGERGRSVIFGAPKMGMQGKCFFTFYVRGENMPPIADGMKVTLVAHDQDTGEWAHSTDTRIYGINLHPEGYTALTFVLETPMTADTYGPEVIMEWRPESEGVSPVLYFDKVEISTSVYETPVITEVWPTLLRYEPGEQAAVRVTVANPTEQEFEVELVGREHLGLTQSREVFRQPVRLAPSDQKEVMADWQLGPEEYGREIEVIMLVGGQRVDSASEVFAVSTLPLWVATGNGYDRGRDVRDLHTIFYVAPATGQESWRSVLFFKKKYRIYSEFFSWAPGDISDLAPQEDPFPGGEGRLTYRSKQTIKMQIEMMKQVGMWPVTYVNGTCWAESGYQLFQRHPEWFIYDSNGEVAHYEMDYREFYQHKDEVDFDPNVYPHIFFQATLNHSLPEVQEYIAEQFIKCGQEMGFNGVRMDVRYLEIHPGELDFFGREIAPTYEEADRISAQAVRNVKRLVHQELPDFTFGYNYCSPEENKNMMLTFQERCEGAAWMLDEVPCTYQSKTSPYHVWKVYVRRMTSWGDQVRKFGGVYNPFDFRRGGAECVIDNIYSSIFRLIASGRFAWYHNSRLPFGDLGQLSTRHSELLFGANLDWLPEIGGQVQVKATAPIWWEDMVFWNESSQGRKQLIVHLVNPPLAEEVEENPTSEIRPPVRDIEVVCAPSEGQAPQAAYLVTAEPMEPSGENEVRVIRLDLQRAPGGGVAITVPSVTFWKMVVFQW